MFVDTFIHNDSIESFIQALTFQRVASLLLGGWILYQAAGALGLYLSSNVKGIPGPFWTAFSNLDLTVSSLQQRRAQVCFRSKSNFVLNRAKDAN